MPRLFHRLSKHKLTVNIFCAKPVLIIHAPECIECGDPAIAKHDNATKRLRVQGFRDLGFWRARSRGLGSRFMIWGYVDNDHKTVSQRVAFDNLFVENDPYKNQTVSY